MKKMLFLGLLFSLNLFAKDIVISDATMKILPPGSKVTSIYLSITNNTDKDIHLKSIAGNFAESFELHNMTTEDGIMRMKKVENILIKKKSTTKLDQSGLHIMVFDLKAPLEEKNYDLTLEFADKKKINTQVKAQKTKSESEHHHH